MTRTEITEVIATLAAVERRLDDSITIMRTIIRPDGTVVRVLKKTVYLPQEKQP